jgi:monofunctional biosynthetic peptidoglycan transglycosylase
MPLLGRVLKLIPALGFVVLVYMYLTLPDVRPLREGQPETTAFMMMREREARLDGEKARRVHRWVSYGRISEHLKRAVLVAEDALFWQHQGIDIEQLQRSLEINLEQGGMVRGASTITQQLAKNIYLSPTRSLVRKLRELMITRRLEAELHKRRILELYLNLIEWGDGIWGAEAAARTYFGKPAARLTPPEAALLAGAIINPRVYSPAQPNARLRGRQRLILRRMRYVEPPPPAPGEPTLPAIPVEPLPTAPGDLIPIEPPPPDIPLAPPLPAEKPGKPPGQPVGDDTVHLDTLSSRF